MYLEPGIINMDSLD